MKVMNTTMMRKQSMKKAAATVMSTISVAFGLADLAIHPGGGGRHHHRPLRSDRFHDDARRGDHSCLWLWSDG